MYGKTLEGAQKFTTKIDDDSFRSRAEARLFGSADTKVVLWSDFKRAAAVNTNWPLHKVSALDDLKSECLRRGLWREEGNHIRRGPFPPPVPEVSIRELSIQEDGDGHTFLKIEPLHAPSVVYETGDSDPTRASSPVPTPARFEATGLRYRFLAFDPADSTRVSAVKEWTAKVRLKYQLHNRGDHYEVELLALPKANGITIRYTTDGSSPTSMGFATYDGPFRVPAKAESTDGQQNVEYSGALEGGYDAAALKSVTEKLQEIVSGGSLRMTIGSLGFPTGQDLLDWLKATSQPFNSAKVTQ
jgi:hypothetical protein